MGVAVSWMTGYLIWGTGLAVACWLVAGSYQSWLAGTAMNLLGFLGHPASVRGLQAPFTFSLGTYAAMCLATSQAPLRVRIPALVIGLLALVGFELLFIIVMTLAVGMMKQHGVGVSPGAIRLTVYTVEVVPWLAAPIAWLTLLGRWGVTHKLEILHRGS